MWQQWNLHVLRLHKTFNILQLLQPHHQSCACHPQLNNCEFQPHYEVVRDGILRQHESSQIIPNLQPTWFQLHSSLSTFIWSQRGEKRSGDPLWKNDSTTDSGRLTLYQSLADSACSGGIALPTYRCFFGKETTCFGTTCCEVFSALWGLKWSNIFMKIHRYSAKQKFPHGLTLREFAIKSQVFPNRWIRQVSETYHASKATGHVACGSIPVVPARATGKVAVTANSPSMARNEAGKR